jgi:hypothetical protein
VSSVAMVLVLLLSRLSAGLVPRLVYYINIIRDAWSTIHKKMFQSVQH